MKKSVSHTRQHCLKINNTTTGPGAAPGGLLAAYVPGDTNTGSIYTSRAYGSVYTNRAQLRRCPTPLLHLSRTRTEERGEFVPATPLAANFAHPIGGGSRLFTLTAERRHERGSKVFILIKETLFISPCRVFDFYSEGRSGLWQYSWRSTPLRNYALALRQ